MKRREFITLIGGAAAWPLAARGQQQVPVIGLLAVGTKETNAFRVDAVRQGLREAGYVEGRDVVIEYRGAESSYDQLSALASNLVDRQVAIIVTLGATNAALVAKAATTTIPIVFMVGSDQRYGLVTSLNRPGANITGVTYLANVLLAKHVEMLHELVLGTHSVGLLVNPRNSNASSDLRQSQDAAEKFGVQLVVAEASVETDLHNAFTNFVREGVGVHGDQ